MNDLLTKLLGASWKTSVYGGIAGLIIIVQGMLENGQVIPDTHPMDWASWGKFAFGIAVAWAIHETKAKGVSNAPIPAPAARVDTVVEPTQATVVAAEKKADKAPDIVNNP